MGRQPVGDCAQKKARGGAVLDNKAPLSDLIGPPPLPCGLSEQPLTIVDPRGSPTAVAGNFGHWQCTDWTTSWPGRRRPSALSERLLQAQTDIGAALGCVKIAGLLKEIDGWTGFTRDFSYQRRVSWWSVNWKPRLSFFLLNSEALVLQYCPISEACHTGAPRPRSARG